MGALQPLGLPADGFVFLLHRGPARVGYQPELTADGAQALVGVVLTQDQAVFAAGGHHAVRLVGALGDQVVDQRADIGVAAPQDEGRETEQLPRGVHPGDKALHGGLLIAGGAVELARAVQPFDLLALQRGIQLRRINAVVFDRIGASCHLGLFQTRDRVQHLDLHLLRHGGGEALHVQLLRIQPHGLDEKLVPRLVREGHDLGLDAGTVAGPHAFDHAGIDGAAAQVRADDLVGALVGIGQITDGAVFRRSLRGKGKGLGLLVSPLDLHFRKVHRAAVDARRRAGLEAAHGKSQLSELHGQRHGCGQPVGAGGAQHLAHDGPPVEVGAGGDDDGAAGIGGAGVRRDGDDASVLHADGDDLRLLDAQIFLALQRVLHDLLIAPPVGLGPQRVHRRAFAQVEHPVLDTGLVRRPGHFTPQRVQLPYQVAFARAADGGVAGHVAHAVKVDREADRVQPQSGGCQSGLNARVTCADDGDIAFSRVVSHGSILSPLSF